MGSQRESRRRRFGFGILQNFKRFGGIEIRKMKAARFEKRG